MSGSTAISRTKPPLPLRWLKEQGLLRGRYRLDYGCGRRVWYGMSGHDPYWKPGRLGTRGSHEGTCYMFFDSVDVRFDTITCIYVLNVVPENMQKRIIRHIRFLLKPNGVAYIAVRRDLPRAGRKGRSVEQRYVELDFPVYRETSTYAIYQVPPA